MTPALIVWGVSLVALVKIIWQAPSPWYVPDTFPESWVDSVRPIS